MFTIKTFSRIFLNKVKSSLNFASVIKMASNESKKLKVSPQTIGTHSGTFHCDEILAVFMLQCLPKFQSHELLRTRDQELLDQCEILVDVGAVYDPATNRFDHHQSSFNETFSTIRPDLATDVNIRLSSAGLIYMHFGEEIIAEVLKKFNTKLTEAQMKNVFMKIYSSFIQEIDAIDNGVPQFDGEPKYRVNTHLSSRVKKFNPDWMEDKTPEQIDGLFLEAKKYVGEEFLDKVKYFAMSWLPARKLVEAAVAKRFEVHQSGEILELERFCPWQEHLRDIEKEIDGLKVKFVVFNSGSGERTDWRVQGEIK